jgi:hypothetical protein
MLVGYKIATPEQSIFKSHLQEQLFFSHTPRERNARIIPAEDYGSDSALKTRMVPGLSWGQLGTRGIVLRYDRASLGCA